jgi:hypothetical protein
MIARKKKQKKIRAALKVIFYGIGMISTANSLRAFYGKP